MNTTLSILVAILSVALALFLVLAILICIQILRLMHNLREIAKRAESVMTSAEAAANVFRRTSGPLSLINFIRSVFDTVAEHKQKNREK